MNGPSRGAQVTLDIPQQREKVAARIDDSGPDHYRLWLLQEPRTPMPVLVRSRVFVHFATAEGVGRILGRVTREGAHGLRFERLAPPQLLRRAEALHAAAGADITVLRLDGADRVAVQARTVEVGGAALTIRSLPGAATGQRYEFDLVLSDREAPVCGRLRVERVRTDGRVEVALTELSAGDRSRLVHYAAEHAGRAA